MARSDLIGYLGQVSGTLPAGTKCANSSQRLLNLSRIHRAKHLLLLYVCECLTSLVWIPNVVADDLPGTRQFAVVCCLICELYVELFLQLCWGFFDRFE